MIFGNKEQEPRKHHHRYGPWYKDDHTGKVVKKCWCGHKVQLCDQHDFGDWDFGYCGMKIRECRICGFFAKELNNTADMAYLESTFKNITHTSASEKE